MSDNLNIFDQALDKLAFRHPVPVEARRFAFYNKRKALKLTLKAFGDYSLFYGLTLRIYFYTKRLGISLSVLQSKIILIITAAIIAGGALYTAISFSSAVLQRNANDVVKNSITVQDSRGNQAQEKPVINYPAKKEDNARPIRDVRYRIGIERLSGDVDEAVLDNMTDEIADSLKILKGTDKIINLRKGKKDKSMNMLLSGSVERLGSTYIITAKIVDLENSQVLFLFSEETNNIDTMNNSVSILAQKIADKLK